MWINGAYALGAMVILTGLLWTIYITENKLETWKVYPLIIVAILFCIGSLLPNFIFKSYSKDSMNGIPVGDFGWGLVLYFVFYLTYGILIIWKLHKFSMQENSSEIKKQFKLIFYGALITLCVTLTSSLIMPLFSIFPFGAIDNTGFLIFLTFIAYSITRHKLFNVRIITIELVTAGLWVILLIRSLMAETTKDALIEGGMLIIAIIFGILLIRSTFNEIKQREQIKKLAEELQSAYTDSEKKKLDGRTDRHSNTPAPVL